MACDRFVHWGAKRPTREEVGMVLEDYLGGIATEIKWSEKGSRFDALLVGKRTSAFARVGGPDDAGVTADDYERWIEVYVADGEDMDVITRRQDWITNRIADGFAAMMAQAWDGKVESG